MLYNSDTLSFQILTVDRFVHTPGVFHVHARPYAAFSYRLHGTGIFQIAGRQIITRPGDVLFLPAEMDYEVEYSVSESIVVHFSQCNYTEPENISLKNPAAIAVRFERLLENWNAQHAVNQAKAAVYDILDKIANDKKTSTDDTAFSRCLRYIDQHFCESSLDVNAICQAGFISASSLQRAFQAHLGLSPKQYLIKIRMIRALDLLAENKLSIKEIAFACGFADEKYFSRAFRQKYGCSPSHFYTKTFV